jgi:hypothetical protein
MPLGQTSPEVYKLNCVNIRVAPCTPWYLAHPPGASLPLVNLIRKAYPGREGLPQRSTLNFFKGWRGGEGLIGPSPFFLVHIYIYTQGSPVKPLDPGVLVLTF